LLPATLLILALSIFPLFFALGLTFTNFRLLGGNNFQFIGLTNWAKTLTDPNVRHVLQNTIIFVIVGVTLQYLLGLGLAMLLSHEGTLIRFFRVSFILPMMIGPISISYVIGRMLFNEAYGPIYDIAHRLGMEPGTWTTSSVWSMGIIILTDTWQWTPLFTLALLAAIQTIPVDLYEAARVDGASDWHAFRYITFPLLMPLSVTLILIRSVEMFKFIDVVRVITGGGPGQATESATLFVYDTGIKSGNIAYAATVAFLLLFIVALYSTGFLSIARRIVPTQE
jgi:multiple sugar transport system permease protein